MPMVVLTVLILASYVIRICYLSLFLRFPIFLFIYLSSMCCTSYLGLLVLRGLVGHSTIPSRECLSHGFLLSYFSFSFSDPEHWGVAIHQGWWRLLVYRLDYILETIEVVDPFTVGAMNVVVWHQLKVKSCCIGLWVRLTPPVNLNIVMLWRNCSFRVVFCSPLYLLKVGTYTFPLRPGALLFIIAHHYVGSCNWFVQRIVDLGFL